MATLFFLLLAAAVALLAVRALRRVPAPVPPRRVPGPVSQRRAASSRVERDALAWDGAPVEPPASLSGDGLRDRLRDRYIAARFPGMAQAASDLARTDHVIRAARLCFEEGRHDLAQELLGLAVECHPAVEALRLAQIEIAYLTGSRGRFMALARAFRAAFPGSPNWAEIARLGRALAPEEPEFGPVPGSRAHPHYGSWDLPNWIQASWDFSGDVFAADFRRAVLRAADGGAAGQPPRAALGG